MTLDQLTEAVLQRLEREMPRAFLIGEQPNEPPSFEYVDIEPYEAVVLGNLSPGELLQMPSDPVCEALLQGIPVYLWEGQRYKKAKHGKLLCKELADTEQRLRKLGIQPMGTAGNLICKEEAARLKRLNRIPPAGSRLTPLAKELMEGTGF